MAAAHEHPAHDHPHGAHGHGAHDHAGHAHAISADADRRLLLIALALIGAFLVVEVVVGLVVGSLALLSDAAHMLTDAAALGLAIGALSLARRPARGAFTFGLKRAEILSALVNGVTLLVFGGIIVVESIVRLIDPPDVPGAAVLVVALVGVAVNLVATATLAKADRRSLNIRGAYLHLLTDLAAFAATAAAGAAIMLTGFHRADGIAALLVAALMLKASYGLIRGAGRVLLEAAPAGVDPDAIGTAMAAQPHVAEVHDLHVWEVTSGFPALSAHVLVGADDDCHAVRETVERMLADRFGIAHTTLQVEHLAAERLLAIHDVRDAPA